MVPRPTHVQGTSLGPVSVRGCLQRQMPPTGQGRLSLQALPVGSVRDIAAFEGCDEAGDGLRHGDNRRLRRAKRQAVQTSSCGSSIRAMHEGERPKPLPYLKSVYVVVYVSVH